MLMRLVVRGYSGGVLHFIQPIEIDSADLDRLIPEICLEHVARLPAKHVIEVEFLDEPNVEERFFRFGTEATGMGLPYEIDLNKLS